MKASLRRRASQPTATSPATANRDWSKPDFRPVHLGILPTAAANPVVAKIPYWSQRPGPARPTPKPSTHRRVMSRTGGK